MRVRQLTLGLTLAALGLTVPIGAQQATAPLRNPDVSSCRPRRRWSTRC